MRIDTLKFESELREYYSAIWVMYNFGLKLIACSTSVILSNGLNHFASAPCYERY